MGQIQVERTPATLKVIEAPAQALMSLAMLQMTDSSEVQIGMDTIWIGTENAVEYQVTGWDAGSKALILRKVG